MFREELVVMPMMRITTDPIGMQPTASIPFGHMADLELFSIFGVLTPLSPIFQLYHGDQF
jgi:hypothetical protein